MAQETQQETQEDEIRIDDTLILRVVHDEADAARFAAFNAAVNGADQGATCTTLLYHHPTATWNDFMLVEDESTGQVVSTTCLIPWRLQLAGVTLTAAMLEMVVTHPDYRRQGLVRRQIDHFHARAAKQGYDLTIIEGIPHYYRQFGYAYALDHWTMDALPAGWIPPGKPDVRLRRAAVADIPTLMQCEAASMAALDLYVHRDAAAWRYLLQAADYPTYIVERTQDEAAVGYVCGWLGKAHDYLSLVESGVQSAAVALSVLRLCKPRAPLLYLGWPQQGMLVQMGRSLGGRPHAGDQWLIRITNLPQLLHKLAPTLAKRLRAAGWADLSGDLVINLYRQAVRLRFVNGHLSAVDSLGFVDASMGAQGGDLCLPCDAFVRLLFGYCTLDQLRDAWPDITVQPARRHLVEAMFAKVTSYMWMPYMNCAHLEPLPFTSHTSR